MTCPRSVESDRIAGVYIVEPSIHGDQRGLFIETYRREWFPNGREMVQGNRANRQAGAVVGLHYHLHQADYWYVPVRHDPGRAARPARGRPDRRRHRSASTSAGENHLGVFIPPGVAHGFAALTDIVITYLVDGYYNPADELGVTWDDPAIAADWGVDRPDPVRPRPGTTRCAPTCRPVVAPTGRCGPDPDEAVRHRRCRVHRLQLRAPRARHHRRRGHRLRRADLRRQPREHPRRARRHALPVRARRHLRPGRRRSRR